MTQRHGDTETRRHGEIIGKFAASPRPASPRRIIRPANASPAPRPSSTRGTASPASHLHRRLPGAVNLPVAAQVVQVGPVAHGQPGCVRRAERGGLRHHGSHHRHAQDVGLELHQQRVVDHAAVNLERGKLHAGILLHGVQHFARLVGGGLQRGAADVALVDEARQPDDGAAGVGLPIGREEAGEGGHKIDAAAVGHLPGVVFDMLGEVKEVQVVAQPLHQGAGDRDRAFERVNRGFVAQLVRHGCQQAVFAWDSQGAGVEQHEAAGAVGVLRLADAETGLPDERRLLVAQVTADGHLAQCVAVDLGVAGRSDRGQHPARDVQDAQNLIIPVQRVQVHQQGAAGVGHIGHVRAAAGAAGQVPDDPRVDVAEDRLAPLRRRAHTRHVVEDPLDLRAGEIGRQRQPGLRPEAILPAPSAPLRTGSLASSLQMRSVRVSCQTMAL